MSLLLTGAASLASSDWSLSRPVMWSRRPVTSSRPSGNRARLGFASASIATWADIVLGFVAFRALAPRPTTMLALDVELVDDVLDLEAVKVVGPDRESRQLAGSVRRGVR